MKVIDRIAKVHTLLLCALILAACNFPGRNSEPPANDTPSASGAESDPDPSETEEPSTDDGTAPEEEGSSDETSPSPVSAVIVPDGWTEHTDSEFGIALHIPPGWEPIAISDTKLDIREVDGFAWLEINIITTETDDSWSIVYTPGTEANAVLSELLLAAQDDGDFDDPYELPSSTGRAVWAIQGVYDVLEEPVFIGTVDQSERLLLVLGHALAEDDWGDVYLPLYESMIQTIAPAP